MQVHGSIHCRFNYRRDYRFPCRGLVSPLLQNVFNLALHPVDSFGKSGLMSNNVSSRAKTITIVGAGFCGALTAINLLRQNPGGTVRIILVDRGARPGRGLAFGTWDDNFLLNVPAAI